MRTGIAFNDLLAAPDGLEAMVEIIGAEQAKEEAEHVEDELRARREAIGGKS